MPSWVVPTVAAELWGVTVEHILAEVAAGRVKSRSEGEFIFVDINPNSPLDSFEADVPAQPSTYRRSLAWTQLTCSAQPVVTAEERQALLEAEVPATSSTVATDLEEDTPYGDAPAPTTLSEDDIPNWEAVRARVARSRRPPAGRDAA
jgi:hypothetical protein